MALKVKKTIREDWLSRELDAQRRTLISGSPEWSRRLIPDGLVTLRAIAHFPRECHPPRDVAARRLWLPPHYDLMQIFITVELADAAAVRAFELAPEAKLLLLCGTVAARASVPIALVAFQQASDPEDEEHHFAVPTHFKVTDKDLGLDGALITPEQYAELVNNRRSPPDLKDPGIKEVNGSVNDVFHWWSRRFLSPQLAINDIDAIYNLRKAESGKTFILELKRSDVRNWLPYLDDVPNFMLLRSLQNGIKETRSVIIQYGKIDNSRLHILTTSQITRTHISGWHIYLNRTEEESLSSHLIDVLQRVEEDGRINGGAEYRSTRSR